MLASENLNCLVHIIEFGNGLVTFQLRGLEFRGRLSADSIVSIADSIREDDDDIC